jgi:hypothetical protein
MPEQPLKKMTQALAETADMSLLRMKQKNGLIKNLMKKNKAKNYAILTSRHIAPNRFG